MGELVQRVATPWATPAPKPMLPHHHEVVVNMDRILRAAGVEEDHVRRRLTAHAIHASGWRQTNCYNYNAWKCKKGSAWTGDVFSSSTLEENEAGVDVPETGTLWRSYPSFAAALENHPVFSMSRYASAKAALLDASRPDWDFFYELGSHGYWTDTHAKKAYFDSICHRVASEMGSATPEELEAPLGEDDTRPFALLPAFAVLVAVTGAVLFAVGVARTMKGK